MSQLLVIRYCPWSLLINSMVTGEPINKENEDDDGGAE